MLKIRRSSSHKRPLPIGIDDAVVMVRHLGPDDRAKLESSSAESRLGANGARDNKKWNRNAPDALIDAGECKGFTNSVVRKLGIDLEEDLPVNEDGEVECTPELMRDLWSACAEQDEHGTFLNPIGYARFVVAIQNFDLQMLTLIEAEKKSASKIFGDS